MSFSLSIIPLNKFVYINVTLLMSLKKKIYIVGLIKKDSYSLLQYEIAKYLYR